VADRAEAVIDVRVTSAAAAESVARAMGALRPHDARTRLTISGGIDRPPLERTPAVASLFQRARTLAVGLGRDLQEGATGGASDGNLTGALGVPTLDGLGAVGGGAHAADEYVLIDDLGWRAALLAGLIQALLTDGT
jgi:glutamate carboxypeptidase